MRHRRARRSLTNWGTAEKVHRVLDREALGRNRQRRRRTQLSHFAHFPPLRVHYQHSPSLGAALPRNGSSPADAARRHRSSMNTTRKWCNSFILCFPSDHSHSFSLVFTWKFKRLFASVKKLPRPKKSLSRRKKLLFSIYPDKKGHDRIHPKSYFYCKKLWQ